LRTFPLLALVIAGVFATEPAIESEDTPPKSDPGRVTVRRLNRYEYDNTIRDLLAVDFHAAADFPADDSGYGFDSIGDVLSLSPVLMDKYLAAAEEIAGIAIPSNVLPRATFQRHSRSENQLAAKDPGLQIEHQFAAEGGYDLLIGVRGNPDPRLVTVSLDDRPLGTVAIETALDDRRTAQMRIHAPFGKHVVSLDLVAGTAPPVVPTADSEGKDGHPRVQPGISYLEIRGPYNPIAPPLSESYQRVFPCGHAPGHHTLECARLDLAALARRAYRRPVTAQEVDGLMRFVEAAGQQGDSIEQGMRVALEAMLVSPRFLFRIENDRIERDPNPSDPAAAHNLTGFELATRLSYFLWSSMPDEELFRLATADDLRKPEILDAQLHRMLLDPKAKSLVENFGGQWLKTRNLDGIQPDPARFPMFDDDLRRAMKHETSMFFESVIREDRSILDFIDAGYTFLNERLAKFYGIPGVEGNEFRRVDLPLGSHRGGILTQAAILTVSSHPTRTSPVLRGKWILENMLNSPPPPPPPDVPNLDDKAIGATGTLRRQLEQHRANPACGACHARMDPLGFGLENYDAIGRWRTHDGNFPVDATGTLPNGESFDGPSGLKAFLLRDKDAFAACLAEKLLTYALGRGLEPYDRTTVESIVHRTAAENYKFSSLARAIVASPAFQMRRGEVPAGAAGQ
jgi:hypothetical protein